MTRQRTRFHTTYGRNLLAELRRFARPPHLVVTMADLWPPSAPRLDRHMATVHFVSTREAGELCAQVDALPGSGSLMGLGGGKALAPPRRTRQKGARAT